MPFPAIPGIIGGLIGTRALHAISTGFSTPHALQTFVRSPLVQGGGFGVGYTSGAYGGYGVSNTFDPLGIHNKSYKPPVQQSLGIMPYGRRYYGRRSYYSRYGRRYRRRRSYRSRYYRRFY